MNTSAKRENYANTPLQGAAQSEADQRRLADALFKAIELWDVDKAIQLASQIHGLDSHRRPSSGDTPLLWAARCDFPVDGASFLLSLSDPLLTAWDGCSALILAALGDEPHSPDLVSLLLPASDPLALTDGTQSALHCAIQNGHLEIIAVLLPHSDLAQLDMKGKTPLERARQSQSGDVADLILGEMARREAAELAACAFPAGHNDSRSLRL